MNVLITGGTGLVGQALCETLQSEGHEVGILSRNKNASNNYNSFFWNIEEQIIDDGAIEFADAVIHLAGANVAESKWTSKRKDQIISSRVDSTNLLFEKFKLKPNKLKAFISASAIGIYGAQTSNEIFTEESEIANDFLGETCKKWEAAVNQFESLNCRLVKLRIAVVLSIKGGALEKMKKPIQFGLGAALGSGKQFMPWIHIDDLVSMFKTALLDEKYNGVYNAVAPEHITNTEFTLALGHQMGSKIRLPNVPSFILKLALGELSVVLLEGSRVSAEKMQKTGFAFKFPTLNVALADLFSA